jgi:hypothetical protein
VSTGTVATLGGFSSGVGRDSDMAAISRNVPKS